MIQIPNLVISLPAQLHQRGIFMSWSRDWGSQMIATYLTNDRPPRHNPPLCLSLPLPHSTGWWSDQWEQRSVMFTGHQWALAPPPTVSWPMGRGLGSSEQTMFSMIISVNIRRSNATSGVSPDCLTSFINGFIDRLHCMNVGSGFVVSSVYRGVASHTWRELLLLSFISIIIFVCEQESCFIATLPITA